MRRLRLRLAMWFLPDGCEVSKRQPADITLGFSTTSSSATDDTTVYWVVS